MNDNEPIAIAGIGCRFPGGANDPATFWRLMMDGVDAIREVPADRWSTEKYFDPRPGRAGRSISKWGGFIDDPAAFDHEFFGISRREAASFDPQHKLLLMAAGEALNDASQIAAPTREAREVGVFVGISTHEFSQLQSAPQELDHLDAWSLNSIAATLAANRISYSYNFSGPSMAVDTACSSSLVAVHLACEAIRRGECEAALAGGANVLYHAAGFVSFSSAGMLSPDGRCKAFDSSANGFVRAEGAGLVFLLPLSAARRRGLRVYAEILATAVNQDARKPSLTAPAPRAQADLIRRACRRAGVAPSSVRYIEAHGTGTPAGDPVEARAIGEVVGVNRQQPCLVGSVKTNIGHLEAAAGIAGLIKAALCLQHETVPGNLHYALGNPAIDFDALGIRVVTHVETLAGRGEPVVAGVNSFGFGGANAHAILRAPQATEEIKTSRSPNERPALLVLSARSPESLNELAARYAESFAKEDAPTLPDVCLSAGQRQATLPHRLAVVAENSAGMRAKLAAAAGGGCPAGATRGRAEANEERAPVFVFCGQGSQWWRMGCRLMRKEPVFRAKMEEAHQLIRRTSGWSLMDELSRDEATTRLDDTAIAQPAIFAIQVALAALWSEWGIRPAAVVGHSVGEAAAAHLSGVLTLEEATRVICRRAEAMAICRGTGSMLSVALPVAELQSLVCARAGRMAVGAINSPRSAVISGRTEEIAELARDLGQRGIPLRKVRVDYAFHSSLMDPAKLSLERSLAGVSTSPPAIPFFSTVTATECTDGHLDASYWWRNIRQPVLFADTIAAMLARGYRDFLEVGPHPVLAGSMLECMKHADAGARVFTSLRRHEPERQTMLSSLGAMCVAGFKADWAKIYPEARSVRLPSYPWKLESTWTELPSCRAARFARGEHPLLGRRSLDAPQVWTGRISTQEQDYLGGHRVHGQPIFPGAGYVELALAAVRERNERLPVCIEGLEFVSAMPVPAQDGERLTRLRFGLDGSTFEISSAARGGEWTLHARGRVAGNEGIAGPPAPDLDEIALRLPHSTGGDELRDNLRRRGLELDGTFAGLRSVNWTEGEALACVVRMPDKEGDRHHFHPAFLDACFGALACTVPGWNGPASNRLFLPVAFGQVRLHRPPTDEVRVHAKLTRADAFAVGGDVRVFDPAGCCICEILDFRARAVATVQRPPLGETGVYEEVWQQSDAEETAGTGWRGRKILLVADRQEWASPLAAAWQKAGGEAELVCAAQRPPPAVADEVIAALRSHEFTRMVFLASPGAEAAGEGNTVLPRDAVMLTTFLGRSAKHRALKIPPMFVVTSGAKSVELKDDIDPFQASLWGLVRTAQAEMPQLVLRLVDRARDSGTAGLITELAQCGEETEVALRQGRRFVSRLRRATPYGLRGARQPEGDELEVRLREPGPGVDVRRRRTAARVGAGQVRVRVQVAGVNFRDAMKSLGIYPMTSDLDLFLGDECAGEVLEVGADVEELREGDKVMAVSPGCFAAEVVADAWRVAKIPEGLAARDAATLPVVFLTALYALREVARIRQGEKILIHSATGGVGMAAVQLAKLFGAETYATAGTEEKRSFLAKSGVARVMDSRRLSFRDEIMEATEGRGVDVVLNSLAGEFLVQSLGCLAPGGRFLEIGKRDIYENARVGLAAFRQNQIFAAIDMAQVLQNSPELTRYLLAEISAWVADGRIFPLPSRNYPLSSAADALRDIAKGRHIGKLVLEVDQSASQAAPTTMPKKDATYLVTGGTRGFGLAAAKWLVSKGARHLVLVGRSGKLPPDGEALVASWQELGVEVRICGADLANADATNALLRDLRSSMPPLRGIIHAATRYESATLASCDEKILEASFGAKAAGAWHLHRGTTEDPIDFFVLYSSVAGTLGNPGQAAYASANAFLEALAFSRRAAGLPALAVSWGVVSDTGHVARQSEIAAALEARGLGSMRAAESMQVLEDLLLADATHAVVARVDWSRAAFGLGHQNATPRMRTLSGERIERGSKSFRHLLGSLPPEEHLGTMTGELAAQLAEVLRVPAEGIQGATLLGDLGLDSLISIETVIRIERRLGINVPPAAVSPERTVAQLASELLQLVRASEAPPAVPPQVDGSGHRPRRAALPSSDSFPLGQSDALAARKEDPQALRPAFYAEWFALRLLSRLFATGTLESARSRLRRLMPMLRLILSQDRAWALKNLRMVFGCHLDDQQRAKLANLAMENHLASYIESGFSDRMEFEFNNYAQLLELAGDHGVILCGVHLGSWEPFLRWAPDIGLRLAAVYRPTRNPLSEKFFQQRRARYGVEWIPSHDTRAIAEAVEARKIVAFMTDLNVYETNLFVDFLGVPASCGTGPAVLAALKGVPVIPAVGIRTKDNKAEATFMQAIWSDAARNAGADIADTTSRMLREFEPWIVEYAEQYNWLHPRWRARPDGARWTLATSDYDMELSRTAAPPAPSPRVLALLQDSAAN